MGADHDTSAVQARDRIMGPWASAAEADGWDHITPDSLYWAAVDGIAWSLLDQTSDLADSGPSTESLAEARATAERALTAQPPQDDPRPDEREALAEVFRGTMGLSPHALADLALAAGFRRDLDAGLRERVRSTVEVAVNTAYGTDGRHGLLARHVAETVVTGKPLPWGLASHFGMSALAEPTPGSES